MECKIGKFLRILFGCHARPERSFFYKEKQFPICARCTGELVGILFGILLAFLIEAPRFSIVLLLMVPMVFDGFLQLLTSYESGNIRRLITGIIFGIAFVFFLIYFHRACVWVAGSILKLFAEDPEKIERAMELLT